MVFFSEITDVENFFSKMGKTNSPRDFCGNSEVIFMSWLCGILHNLLFQMVLVQVKTTGYEA